MTIIKILESWLKANGYDGLCDGDDCGCIVGDLCPCDSPWLKTCQAGYDHGPENGGDFCVYLDKKETK